MPVLHRDAVFVIHTSCAGEITSAADELIGLVKAKHGHLLAIESFATNAISLRTSIRHAHLTEFLSALCQDGEHYSFVKCNDETHAFLHLDDELIGTVRITLC